MTEEGKIRLERFNGANFGFWKMQIKDSLYQKNLYLSLNGKAQKLKEVTDDEWEFLDQKALGAIWLSLTSIIAFNISREKMTQDLIMALSKMYEKPSASNKIFFDEEIFLPEDGGHWKRRWASHIQHADEPIGTWNLLDQLWLRDHSAGSII